MVESTFQGLAAKEAEIGKLDMKLGDINNTSTILSASNLTFITDSDNNQTLREFVFKTNGDSGTTLLRIRDSGTTSFGGTPETTAILSLDSTSKGFLPPRMTTTQRDAISSPVAGLMIYNTTTNKLNVYTTAWEAITSA